MANAAGEDLSFLDGLFDDCAADNYQGIGLELEVYKFDYAGRYWNGPYFYWSELYQTPMSFDNIKVMDPKNSSFILGSVNFLKILNS